MRAAGMAMSCVNAVPCEGRSGAVGINTVLAALADPDVVAALGAAPILYGHLIPDAGTFQITFRGRTISIGFACAGAPGCTDPPAGVARLRTLLEQLTSQQVAAAPCDTTFPDGGF
jgi:hypothetical protein